MRGLFILILLLTRCLVSQGQLQKFESAGNLFVKYRSPVIDSAVYKRLESDETILYLGCYFTTDTSGKVTAQKFTPLSEIGNEYAATDSIWQSVITSFTEASKKWVFKPILWEFKCDEKKADEYNKKWFQRPFTGRPRYFIIAEVAGIRSGFIDKISYMQNFEVGK